MSIMDISVGFGRESQLLTNEEVRVEVDKWVACETPAISNDAAKTITSWYMTPRTGDIFTALAHGYQVRLGEALDWIKVEVQITRNGQDQADLLAVYAVLVLHAASQVRSSPVRY